MISELSNGHSVANLARVQQELFSSSTKRRIQELQECRDSLETQELPAEAQHVLVQYLLATYPFYVDRPSRRAVQRCITTLCSELLVTDFVPIFLSFIQTEAVKSSIASSSTFVLLEWCSIVLKQISGNADLWAKYGVSIASAAAVVLERCLAYPSKPSRRQTAISVTRFGLKSTLANEEIAETATQRLLTHLTAKSGRPTAYNAPYIGIIAAAATASKSAQAQVTVATPDICAFYVREIVGSKTPVPAHIAKGLSSFFRCYVDEAVFNTQLAPAIEKALLRAPEVILQGVMLPLISSLPTNIDLSTALAQHLQKSLIANVKSSNASMRTSAIAAFEAIAETSHDQSQVLTVCKELNKNIKDNKAAEQRAAYLRMLGCMRLDADNASENATSLIAVATKETSDQALEQMTKTITKLCTTVVRAGSALPESLIKAVNQGLKDKKTPTKRSWALCYTELQGELSRTNGSGTSQSQKLANDVEGNMLLVFKEVATNPIAAAQSGLFATACAVVALVLDERTALAHASWRKKFDVDSCLESTEGKPSFLLNHKAYTKLTDTTDLTWLLRALMALVSSVNESGSNTGKDWSQAVIFAASAPSVPPSARLNCRAGLHERYLRYPEIVAPHIIRGVWLWVQSAMRQSKDTPATSTTVDVGSLHLVVKAICPKQSEILSSSGHISSATLQTQFLQMLVLCRPTLVRRISWIEQCLQSGLDPGALISENVQRCFDNIQNLTSNVPNDAFAFAAHQAACEAAADMCFVAPEISISHIVKLLEQDMELSQMGSIGATEASIYRTPEGVPFVDVLAGKSNNATPDKNVKDYDTLKWEQELREQLAKKQNSQKKLTADEQAKVKEQLAKESSIRERVAQIAARILRATGIIRALVRGPPTNTEKWFGVAVARLTALMPTAAGLLVGEQISSVFIELSRFVSSRLAAMRSSLGIATLRAYGNQQLPEGADQEPLADLILRVLYRLRFSGEQRTFDLSTLMYAIPLVHVTLTEGGVGKVDEEIADEQIALALEFLSLHVDLFSNDQLPRRSTLSILFQSMQKYGQHYRTLKDCILGISHALAADVTPDELAILLRNTIVADPSIRQTALQAIDESFDFDEGTFRVEIWLACHDGDEQNAQLGKDIWDENSLSLSAQSALLIIEHLQSLDQQLRKAAARALAACIQDQRDAFTPSLNSLIELYDDKAKKIEPQRDAFGILKKTDLRDPWEARHGVALALNEMASVFESSKVVALVKFLIEHGPLGDRNEFVREEMISATTRLITIQGAAQVEPLMKLFETTLEAPDSTLAGFDKVNEAIIILYGALAQHLQPGDERVPKVIERLTATLSTPSESVQLAIANCLPALVRLSSVEGSTYIRNLLEDLLHAKAYATRRGAAYGLAGVVKGKGISILHETRVLSSIKVASEDKKDPIARQGAFIGYELLSLVLERKFEPYAINIVPQLLSGFGDANTDVREACLDASKTFFSTLTSFGVKRVLPVLLEGLQEHQWRSKKGACDSLGAMAYLDPQQLAMSLPEIIPALTTVLTDSHKEVRAAANRSLQRFGEVISNPEIKSLVNVLLKALSDPTKHTDEALDALLKVNFVHYLDAPSLALVVGILDRGLADRSNTKRKAAQIIGSLAHLTERKDLTTHLPTLVSGLRVAAVDPVPTTRATASKALGSLVEKLGEDALPDLIPSLMSALKTDTGAGDRLGSAQALSEVLAGLGIGRLEDTLPSILQNVTSAKAAVREGFMSLFIFLPACFGSSFANYLSKIIPPILSGLADDVDTIRETSLRAGRLLVKNFATRAIDLLLPELQRGLGDYNYRIRLSSVELVGDLLFNLTGVVNANAEDGEDEIDESAVAAGHSLLEVLGEEKRNNVLSALYISRCDTSGLVRAAAINVWKALVATPRTLREITPTLTQVIIRRLASSNSEQKHIAGNALGELIRKAGERVLASLLPTLEESMETSTDTDAKQGICIALRELISSAPQESLEEHESKIVAVVKSALVDSNPEVREAAAEAFDALQRLFGKKVVDKILPPLLALLRNENEAENALAGLLTLLTSNARSNVILPNLLPTLLASPVSAFNARALASLASVAGSALTRRLTVILNTLIDNIISCSAAGGDEDRFEALNSAIDAVMLSVDEFDGLNALMAAVLSLVKHDDHRKRKHAELHLATFFAKTELDYSRYYADLIRVLLIAFDDRDPEVVKAAWLALSGLTTHLRKEEMESLVISTKQVLSQVGVKGHELPGFQLSKGITAVLPIFLQGLINGTPDQRTQAAIAIDDIIDKTGPDALKPFVTQITGPLIRVVSERSTEVKEAILLTLNHLLEKIPTFIKPFLPQLQRTFTKSLADPTSETLRMRAARALGTLITLTPRIDPLISELVNGSRTADAGVRNAMQKALYEVVSKVGHNMSEQSRGAVITLIDEDTAEADEATTITNARLLGALIKNLPPDSPTCTSFIKSRVLTSHFTRSSVLAINAVLVESPGSILKTFESETVTTVCRGMRHANPMIAENCVLAAGKYLLSEQATKSFDNTKTIFEAMVPLMQPGAPIDARRLSLVIIRTVSRQDNGMVRPHLGMLVPPVFASVRDMVIPIKLAAEAAFLGMFCVVTDESVVFEKYLAGAGADLPVGTKRSMQDYFKRVAIRLAGQARERQEAEGGQEGSLGLSNDERDDEREIWSVGKVDLGESAFATDA